MWTKNTIDISIFHEWKGNSNIYNNSYIKQYLEKVVKVKMQVRSIGLPWLKNKNVDIMDEDTASQYSNTQAKRDKLKWKKLTDYTKDVQPSYKILRNINKTSIYEQDYSRETWLGTQQLGYSHRAAQIKMSGEIYNHPTNIIFGLRPVITK